MFRVATGRNLTRNIQGIYLCKFKSNPENVSEITQPLSWNLLSVWLKLACSLQNQAGIMNFQAESTLLTMLRLALNVKFSFIVFFLRKFCALKVSFTITAARHDE